MRERYVVATMVAVLFAAGASFAERYEPNWESLARHPAAPDWLKDAKLGIYFHWGVYSVPAYGSEWYPSLMHQKGHDVYKHHLATYGGPATYGYHDFVPEFTAEQFDPEEWADLFQRSGARFAGPVAEHHDGFAMWDSEVTPWNARVMGPKRDVLGELFAALRKRDMKTIATFHHARNLQRYRDTWQDEMKREGRKGRNSHYLYNRDWPTASDDPKLRLLYGNVPEDEWLEDIWLGKLKEVIDRYQPDILWFDSWLDQIPEIYRQRMAAYYLNAADGWGKDVVLVRKQNDLPLSFTVNDHEKSREPDALPDLWMTDDTISTGSWCYTRNLRIKSLPKVVHALVDAVSKNGVVLLNISPKADGVIPDDQRKVLLGLGEWLEANGEAIYDTRPWLHAAEGPTSEPGGGFADRRRFLQLEYTAEDVRYTASKDGRTVFAILLGAPAAGSTFLLESMSPIAAEVADVQILPGGGVEWTQTTEGLRITLPAHVRAASPATAFRVSLAPGRSTAGSPGESD